LDANFSALSNFINNLLLSSNYFEDSSGAANQITVTVPSPLIFTYTKGVPLNVKIANTNTAIPVNINVNGLGNRNVTNPDGNPLVDGQFIAGRIVSLIYDGTAFRIADATTSSLINTMTIFSAGEPGNAATLYLAGAGVLPPSRGLLLQQNGSNNAYLKNFETGGFLTLGTQGNNNLVIAPDGSASLNSVPVVGRLSAKKGSDTARTSAVKSDDPDLKLTLAANTMYKVTALIPFYSSTGTGNQGFSIGWNYTGSITGSGTVAMANAFVFGTTQLYEQFLHTPSNSFWTQIGTTAYTNVITYTGFISTNAGGTLSIQWAVNTNNGSATSVELGAYLIAEPI